MLKVFKKDKNETETGATTTTTTTTAEDVVPGSRRSSVSSEPGKMKKLKDMSKEELRNRLEQLSDVLRDQAMNGAKEMQYVAQQIAKAEANSEDLRAKIWEINLILDGAKSTTTTTATASTMMNGCVVVQQQATASAPVLPETPRKPEETWDEHSRPVLGCTPPPELKTPVLPASTSLSSRKKRGNSRVAAAVPTPTRSAGAQQAGDTAVKA